MVTRKASLYIWCGVYRKVPQPSPPRAEFDPEVHEVGLEYPLVNACKIRHPTSSPILPIEIYHELFARLESAVIAVGRPGRWAEISWLQRLAPSGWPRPLTMPEYLTFPINKSR